jgi:uncharacterized protein YjbI with pentapeptide repeats
LLAEASLRGARLSGTSLSGILMLAGALLHGVSPGGTLGLADASLRGALLSGTLLLALRLAANCLSERHLASGQRLADLLKVWDIK